MQPCGLPARAQPVHSKGLGPGAVVLSCRQHRRGDLRALAQPSQALGLAVAEPTSYWPAADVHVRCFYHQKQKKNHGKNKQHTMFRELFDRVDRSIALQVNDALAARAGNNVLLIAYLGEPLSGGSTEAHQNQAELEAQWQQSQDDEGRSARVATTGSRQTSRRQSQVRVARWHWVNGPLAQAEDVSHQQQSEEERPARPGLTNLLQGAVELAQSFLPFTKDSQDAADSRGSGSASTATVRQLSRGSNGARDSSRTVSEDSPFLGAGGPLVGVPPSSLDMAARMLRPDVRPGVGVCAEACNIVGVANLDAFGDLVPPRTLNPFRDGAFGWIKREGVAYVSNMAVLPQARRMGTARALMEAAEQLAVQWGCRSVGLHCNPNNAPALGLYRSMGYHLTPAIEAPWVPYLQGRPPDRCVFMLKLLPAKARAQYQQQLQEQQASSLESQLAAATTLPS